jgi:hypothetical protein
LGLRRSLVAYILPEGYATGTLRDQKELKGKKQRDLEICIVFHVLSFTKIPDGSASLEFDLHSAAFMVLIYGVDYLSFTDTDRV